MLHLPDNKLVNLLIGNDNAFLMTVLEEREGTDVRELHAVLSKIGWYACGDVSPPENTSAKICRVQACVKSANDVLDSPFNHDIVSRDNKIRELNRR